MAAARLVILLALWMFGAGRFCASARAMDLRGDLRVLGQARNGDQSRDTEVPVNLYGDLGAERLHYGAGADAYVRLAGDLARDDGAGDFYAGRLRMPVRGVELSLGRQFVSEVPGGVFVADAGRVRIDPGGPVAVTLFGGQPRYFEPTAGAPSLSQDEQVFGGSIRTTRLRHGYAAAGFLQQQRDQRTLRQLVSAAAGRAFTTLPGVPTVYGTLAFDADRQNIDRGTIGVDAVVPRPRLSFNFESGYYKPQDQGRRVIADLNRREDPIFELFSVSQMLQLRGGARYTLRRAVSLYGDYSYQRYERLRGVGADGHVASAGLLWLPGGDGLEAVRAEYYVADSNGGAVNGGRLSYESRAYERVLLRAKIDVSAYDKASHARATAVSGRLGVGYLLASGLLAEISLEGNHNPRFDEEVRVGVLLTYVLRCRPGAATPPPDPLLQRQPGGWAS